jgi:hypothetical protein
MKTEVPVGSIDASLKEYRLAEPLTPVATSTDKRPNVRKESTER